VGVLESVGGELQALLSPVAPETFVREYWGTKPLFVKGFSDKFRGLFSREAFIRMLSAPGPAPDDFLQASFDKGPPSRSSRGPRAHASQTESSAPQPWASEAFKVNVQEALPLLRAGATLCATQIETRVPALAPLLAAIKCQLGYPGKVYFNAYLSPPDVGFNWHFDARIASTLQIEGAKLWRFSHRPAVPWPRSNGALRADGTGEYTDPLVQQLESMGYWQAGKENPGIPFDENDTTEVLLEPGDLLILPAGVWHDARGGAAGSLALNMSFAALSYTMLVRSLLDAILTPDPRWRGPSPLLPLPGGAPGEMDPHGIAAITAQLASAADALRSLAGDSAAVVRLWGSYVQNPNPGFAVSPAPPVAATSVVPEQRLRVRADGRVFPMLADAGTRLCLAVGAAGAIEVVGSAIPFVQRILAEKEFVASDCLGWNDEGSPYTWGDVEAMLTRLKCDGLIEDVVA
jgi:hypothetical protein